MIINVKNVTVEKPGINSTCIICHQFLLCSLKGKCVVHTFTCIVHCVVQALHALGAQQLLPKKLKINEILMIPPIAGAK